MQGPVTTIRMPKIRNVIANCFRTWYLRGYVSIDGFVGRINNEHLTNTIQSSWVLWCLISLFSAKNQDLRPCFNWCWGKRLYAWQELYFVGHAAWTEPMIVLNIIILNLKVETNGPLIFLFVQKSSEICARFPICFIARLWVGVNISEEWYWWSLFEFVAYTRFLCFVINNYSSCFCRISWRIQISILGDCRPL
jgi:hypothetical protein